MTMPNHGAAAQQPPRFSRLEVGFDFIIPFYAQPWPSAAVAELDR